MRACRNAIEFNSIPSINRLIPDVSNVEYLVARFLYSFVPSISFFALNALNFIPVHVEREGMIL